MLRGKKGRHRVMAALAFAAAGFAASALSASPASGAVTVGSNLAGSPGVTFNCDIDNQCTVSQATLDGALTAPGGITAPSSGVVVRWRIEVGPQTGPMNLRVVRAAGGGMSSGGGTSGAQVTPPINMTMTYPTRIPIAATDRIGLDCCQMNGVVTIFEFVAMGSGTFDYFNPVLGSTPVLPTGTNGTGANGVAIHLNADIEADADADAFGDETQDNCIGTAGPNNGCPLVVPSISTQATASATVGGQISDTATLAGGSSPTGTITFRAYGPNDATCSGAASFTDTEPVAGNGTYTTNPAFTPAQAGTYRWVASYAGDVNNTPVSGACNDPNETSTVNQFPPVGTPDTSSTPAKKVCKKPKKGKKTAGPYAKKCKKPKKKN